MAKQKISAREAKIAANALEKLLSADMVSRRHVYKENFVRGLFFSVGGVIGATVGVGIIAWTLSLFNQVPLVGKFTRSVEQTINENK